MVMRARRNLARNAVGSISVGFGIAALAVPEATAQIFGLDVAKNPALPMLVRFVGVRNLVMGIAALQASTRQASGQALRNGLLVGVADVAAVLAAYDADVVPEQSRNLALAMLGGIAALGGVGLLRN
jgi:hypothetical protein